MLETEYNPVQMVNIKVIRFTTIQKYTTTINIIDVPDNSPEKKGNNYCNLKTLYYCQYTEAPDIKKCVASNQTLRKKGH